MNKIAQLTMVKQALASEYLQKQAAIDNLIKVAISMPSMPSRKAMELALKKGLFGLPAEGLEGNPLALKELWAQANKLQKARALGLGVGLPGAALGLGGYGAYEALDDDSMLDDILG